MKIWKWPLEITDRQVINMPVGSKILSAQIQGREAQLWALCDETAPKEERTIAIYGTGNPVPDDPGEYISSFQMFGGSLVWHVFEIKEKKGAAYSI